MKVSGFSFVRNAVKYSYPVVESITSILPLCDEFVLCLGNSDDGTEELISQISSDKLKIVHSVWDDSLREGGKVLAVETDKAFDAVSTGSDWCFYIQADEVVHEKYLPIIREAMEKWKDHPEVEGLLFHWAHFYATFNYLADSRTWYRNEIRIIRNDKKIRSYKDAQGFRREGRKLNVKETGAYIYHYGWVKDPQSMKLKEKEFNALWHDDNWIKNNVKEEELFDYSKIDSLTLFKGTHPAVMKQRIAEMNWNISLDISKKKFSFKDKLLYLAEKYSGYRPFEYKNYRIV